MNAPSPRTESAWRDPRFRVFAAGNGINSVGESMYALAVPLLAFEITGSLTAMALLAAAYPLVIALSGPLLGVAVDRFGSKLLVLPGLTVQIVAALALNLVLLAGVPSIAYLFVTEVLVQLGAIAYRAGWMAGLPGMFPDKVARARGALSTTYQAAVVLGPALAAVLVGPAGVKGLLWINLLTFLPPILVWFAGINPVASQARARQGGWHVLADLREGWGLLRSSRYAYAIILVLVPLNLVFSTGTIALVVFYLQDALSLSKSDVGVVFTVANVAALAGAAFVSERPRRSIGAVCVIGLLGTSLALMAIPATNLVVVAAAGVALLFLLTTCVEVAADMVIYENVPAEAIGRSLGFYRLMLGTPAFFGPLLIAGISSSFGARAAFLVLGVVAFVPGVALALWRSTVFPAPALEVQVKKSSCE